MAGEIEPQELPDVDERVVSEGEAEALDAARSPIPELSFVMDVPLRLSVAIGSTKMLVRDVLQLAQGSVVELDRMNGEPADVFVNDRMVAKGEVTVVENRLAVRIIELLKNEEVESELG